MLSFIVWYLFWDSQFGLYWSTSSADQLSQYFRVLSIKGCRVDTNLLSVEESDNWCFGDIKVITETLGISVPAWTASSVHRFEGNMQQTWKDKERVLSLLGSVCSGHCGYYWGQYHAELAPRPSDARTTLSECGNSHFCFLFSHFAQKLPWQQIQSWAFSLISILIEVSHQKS